jgi:phytoene dehydrogenase-like protein
VTSPAVAELHLEDHGLRWTHAPAVVGHARSATDQDALLIHRDIEYTAAELDRHQPGGGSRWRALFEQWQRIKGPLLSTLFLFIPPVRGPTRLLRTLGTAGALELSHLMLLPAGVMAQQLFEGDAARLLLLGNAMHADVPIDAPGSGVMGYLLIMMAQDDGFPLAVGGAGQLTTALVHRAASAGAQIECQYPASAIEVKGGPVVALRTAGGDTVRVRRAVIADTSAPQLYQSLLPADVLPASLLRNLGHFVWDTPVAASPLVLPVGLVGFGAVWSGWRARRRGYS